MLIDKIKNKEKTIATINQLSDISISRIFALSGYDFIWIDMEHSYLSFEQVYAQVLALQSGGVECIVRVPENDLSFTKKVLEMGVSGIIFPRVKTAEDAERLIFSTLYPPYGTRGFGPMGANDFGLRPPFDYTKNAHREMLRFIQIEDRETIENLDEIMKNEYIDGYIFGPNDLSGSYGILGEVYSDKITEIITGACEKLRAAGKYIGFAVGYSEESLKHWTKFDADMIVAGADFDFVRDGALENRKRLERLFKA